MTMARRMPAEPGPGADRGSGKSCDAQAFADLKLENAQLKSASLVTGGSYTPQGSQTALTGLPASFCRLTGTATPSSDSLINFEIWVPTGAAWNGKLVTTGNGGYSPNLNYGDMAMRSGRAMRLPAAIPGTSRRTPTT